jgi:hypothetical protein
MASYQALSDEISIDLPLDFFQVAAEQWPTPERDQASG